MQGISLIGQRQITADQALLTRRNIILHKCRGVTRIVKTSPQPLHLHDTSLTSLLYLMGSSSSKVAGKAAGAVGRRQYPSSSSILNSAISTSPAPSAQATSAAPVGQSLTSSRVRPEPFSAPPSGTRSEHIDLDGRDPDFGSKLSRLGPAVSVGHAKPGQQAFPTSSRPPLGQQGKNIFPTQDAKHNPSLLVVQARGQTGKKWEEEQDDMGKSTFEGRTLISAKEIRDVLEMRGRGMESGDIEKQLRLKRGIVERLGAKEAIANA